ncbi:hypothetical protein BpHYR1_043390 [Brachionus plicatilis]|uniref:Uncharacterized protein n=1 Tax=Brachionus plicatilis TaxID=10195 RepID=A0A3M7QVV9_BRAPC|nr:hypothetical protein BpHYR1_043390 [Brachionus plicatilis]
MLIKFICFRFFVYVSVTFPLNYKNKFKYFRCIFFLMAITTKANVLKKEYSSSKTITNRKFSNITISVEF